MSNGLKPFNQGFDYLYDHQHVRSVLERPLDPRLIKEREQGKTKLSYIGGHTVIRLLNEAFGYKWSYEIVTEEIMQTIPKVMTQWNNQTRKKETVFNPDGSPKLEYQPPVAKVLGRLTIPGYGVKEQYGSKILIGGASEQESAFKAASTDAMKKCASLFGIGLELYEGEDEKQVYSETAHAIPLTQPLQPLQTPVVILEQTVALPEQTIVEEGQEAQPQQVHQPSKRAEVASDAPAQDPNAWHQADIDKLKELKAILGITENDQLDPYVREFLDNQNVSYMHIIPTNIKAFNIFLTKKVQNV